MAALEHAIAHQENLGAALASKALAMDPSSEVLQRASIAMASAGPWTQRPRPGGRVAHRALTEIVRQRLASAPQLQIPDEPVHGPVCRRTSQVAPMKTHRYFAGLAVVIVMAGLADPVWTRSANVPPAAYGCCGRSENPHAVAAVSSRLWACDRSPARFARCRTSDCQWDARATASRSACPAEGGCLIVSNGSTPLQVSAGAKVIGGLQIPRDASGQIAIERIDRPDRVNAIGVGRLNVWLRGAETNGRWSSSAFDEGMLVGERDTTASRRRSRWIGCP